MGTHPIFESDFDCLTDQKFRTMSLVSPDKFQHILRVQNTNIDGTRNIQFAMTAIRGIGRRFSNLICKKADIDISKRAGQLDDDEIKRMDTKIGKTEHLPNVSPMDSTLNFVKILSDSRRSVPIVVSVTTGFFVFVVNIQRRPEDEEEPSESQRRSKPEVNHFLVFLEK